MMSSSEDDDDVPEGLTFASGKETALKDLKSIKESLSREAELKKRKNQAIQQRNIEQKKSKKLPLDVLEQADAAIEQDEARKRRLCEKQEEEMELPGSDEDELSENDAEDEFVTISRLKDFKKPLNESARDFKNQHLYQGKIKRMSLAKLKQMNTKTLIRKHRNFINTDLHY